MEERGARVFYRTLYGAGAPAYPAIGQADASGLITVVSAGARVERDRLETPLFMRARCGFALARHCREPQLSQHQKSRTRRPEPCHSRFGPRGREEGRILWGIERSCSYSPPALP
jgi:hypothetical protein